MRIGLDAGRVGGRGAAPTGGTASVAANTARRAAKVESLIRQTRSGELSDPRFRTRMRGEGEVANQIARVFKVFQRKYRLDGKLPDLDRTRFRRTGHWVQTPEKGQLALFGTP